MAITRLGGANAISGTIPQGNIANASLGAVTALPAAISTGKVLQVVTVTDDTNRSTTSTSFAHISQFDLAITPSATSSKIFLSFSGLLYKGDGGGTAQMTFYRDSTDLKGSSTSFAINDGDNAYDGSTGLSYLDSPNTTSQVTYKVYMKVGSGTAELVNSAAKGSFTAFEIGA